MGIDRLNTGRFSTPTLKIWMARLLPLWCALAFIALSSTAAKQEVPSQDSYQYAANTLEYLGVPPEEAHLQALRMVCQRKAWADERYRALHPWQRFELGLTGVQDDRGLRQAETHHVRGVRNHHVAWPTALAIPRSSMPGPASPCSPPRSSRCSG